MKENRKGFVFEIVEKNFVRNESMLLLAKQSEFELPGFVAPVHMEYVQRLAVSSVGDLYKRVAAKGFNIPENQVTKDQRAAVKVGLLKLTHSHSPAASSAVSVAQNKFLELIEGLEAQALKIEPVTEVVLSYCGDGLLSGFYVYCKHGSEDIVRENLKWLLAENTCYKDLEITIPESVPQEE